MIPNKRIHWLYAYKDVIDSIQWGLEQLGHQVSYGLNYIENNALNIIFGHRLLTVELLKKLPKNTIIYNLEQIEGLTVDDIFRNESNKYCFENFQMWEYSIFQKNMWNKIPTFYPVKFVKIGYAPVLTRIKKKIYQEIDVLLYGATVNKRLKIYHDLCCAGHKTVFLCGIYGKLRDDLISQSKIILNINKYDRTKIFEIVRVSYLMANKKAVLSDKSTELTIESDLTDSVRMVNEDSIVDECSNLLVNNNERKLLEERGYEAIIKRDIREILSDALQLSY
jgi:hypothetical protein